MELGLGEIGLKPDEFWNLTFAEFFFIVDGHYCRIERQWEHTRYLATWIINMNIAKGKQVKPTDLVKLRFDKPKKIEKLDTETINKLKAAWLGE